MILGVDIGLGGAFALIDGKKIIKCWDVPVKGYELKSGKVRKEIDVIALQDIIVKNILPYNVEKVYVEKTSPNAGKRKIDSPMTGYSMGRSFGEITCLLKCYLGVEIIYVMPVAWKRKVGLLKKRKEESISKCYELMDHNRWVTLKKHIDRAEAALIAYSTHNAIM